MNKQVVVCVLMLLTASRGYANDSVSWMSKFKVCDMPGGPTAESLNKTKPPFGASAEFICNSYDSFRSKCVNSSLLRKCPQALQKLVKNNFGLMTIATGATVSGLVLWQLSKRRYASSSRNGTGDDRTQVMEDPVEELANTLPVACASDATGPAEFIPNNGRADRLPVAAKDITQVLRQAGPWTTALNQVTAGQLRSGVELLSHPLLGLRLTSKKKEVKVCLDKKDSGQEIRFVLQSAKGTTALKRLQDNWNARGMPKGIRDIMIEYATYVLEAGEEKELDVKFSAAEIICVSNQACLVGNSAPYKTMPPEWVLMAHGETDKGALVWPPATHEQFNEYALADVLDRFLHVELIKNNNFVGIKKYVTRLDGSAQPAQQVMCKIAPHNISPYGGKKAHVCADRIITLCANGKEVMYTIERFERNSVVQLLAHETLRRQIIEAIAHVHALTKTTAVKLRLNYIENGCYCYIAYDDQEQEIWETEPFIVPSSSDAAQPSSSTEPNSDLYHQLFAAEEPAASAE